MTNIFDLPNSVSFFCEQCFDAAVSMDNIKILETLPPQVCQSCFGLIDPEVTFTIQDVSINNGEMLEAFGKMNAQEIQDMCATWFGDSEFPENIGVVLHGNIKMIALTKLIQEGLDSGKKFTIHT